MKVMKAIPQVGEMVTLIMTKESKDITKQECGLASDMFKEKRMKVTDIYDNRSCTLSDGYDYSLRSIKALKNRVFYDGNLNDTYSYSGLEKSGILQVGCQRIPVTDQLIKDLKAIQKPKRKSVKK